MHLNRRALLLGGLLATTVLTPVLAQSPIAVIYVGAEDCPPCFSWKVRYKAEWLASPEFRKVQWIEIESRRLTQAYRARFWEGGLEPILEQIPHRAGTPRFLIVQNGRIIDNHLGVSTWPQVFSEVKALVG